MGRGMQSDGSEIRLFYGEERLVSTKVKEGDSVTGREVVLDNMDLEPNTVIECPNCKNMSLGIKLSPKIIWVL